MRFYALFLAGLASAAAITQQKCSRDSAQGATEFAYIYGFPLIAASTFIRRIPNAQTNRWYHQRNLANASGVGVVRPNADTVYSGIFLDLSGSDVEIDIPAFTGRYWVVPFYDLYGNNIGNIGSITGNSAGKYLIKYGGDNYGVQGGSDGYQGVIYMPTAYGLVIQRVLVTDDTSDIETVRGLQNQETVQVHARYGSPVAPTWDLSLFSNPDYVPSDSVPAPLAILRLTAALADYQLPLVASDRPRVAGELAAAGISGGKYNEPSGVDLSTLPSAAEAAVRDYHAQAGAAKDMGNNWTIYSVVGNYLTEYVQRYFIARVGYLVLAADQAIYPFYPDISLPSGKAGIFTFSAKPKITSGGFWSLTAYDSQGFLVKNSLNRYALGNYRGNLTFPDGTPLYPNGPDGSFQILLQSADVTPPANWTGNWLPVGNTGGTFQVTLRWYGGESVLNQPGAYEYPSLQIVDALQG